MGNSREINNDPFSAIWQRVKELEKRFNQQRNIKSVNLPFRTFDNLPAQAAEGDVVIGTDGTLYGYIEGVWAPLGGASSGSGFMFPISIPGVLDTLTGDMRWFPQFNGSIDTWHISLGTAPTGSSFTARLNKNGSSVTTLSISASAHEAVSSPAEAFTVGDYFTLDITAVGSSIHGSNFMSQWIGS